MGNTVLGQEDIEGIIHACNELWAGAEKKVSEKIIAKISDFEKKLDKFRDVLPLLIKEEKIDKIIVRVILFSERLVDINSLLVKELESLPEPNRLNIEKLRKRLNLAWNLFVDHFKWRLGEKTLEIHKGKEVNSLRLAA